MNGGENEEEERRVGEELLRKMSFYFCFIFKKNC